MKKDDITIDNIPDIQVKFLKLLNDEADRIADIPAEERNTQDLNMAIKCFNALTASNTSMQKEIKGIKNEINLFTQDKVDTLLEAHKPDGRTVQLFTKEKVDELLEAHMSVDAK